MCINHSARMSDESAYIHKRTFFFLPPPRKNLSIASLPPRENLVVASFKTHRSTLSPIRGKMDKNGSRMSMKPR